MITVDRTQPRNYEEHGFRYFGVTSICHAMMGEDAYVNQASLDRGTDLHVIFSLYVGSLAGRCAPPLVPPQYVGYFKSMQLGLDILKPEPELIERKAISLIKGMPFAGTPDLLAWVWWRGKRVLALIDLKTGMKQRWHSIQVMAYRKLQGYGDAEMVALFYIKEDGSQPVFDVVKSNPRDWAAFQATLSLLIWRES